MNINNHYTLAPFNENTFFRFDSVGEKGRIQKWIWFQFRRKNRYNLAFGDFIGGELSDSNISNNQDFVRVMSTVAFAIREFLKEYPKSTIEIRAVDDKRLGFYHTIFKRHLREIQKDFMLFGILDKQKEAFNPEKCYDRFEVKLRNAEL